MGLEGRGRLGSLPAPEVVAVAGVPVEGQGRRRGVARLEAVALLVALGPVLAAALGVEEARGGRVDGVQVALRVERQARAARRAAVRRVVRGLAGELGRPSRQPLAWVRR